MGEGKKTIRTIRFEIGEGGALTEVVRWPSAMASFVSQCRDNTFTVSAAILCAKDTS